MRDKQRTIDFSEICNFLQFSGARLPLVGETQDKASLHSWAAWGHFSSKYSGND